MIIERMYLKNTLDLMKQFPVVVIGGARQIGKTTLAKQLGKKIKKKAIMYDLEKPSDAKKLEDLETVFSLNKDKLIIIDEAQTMPKLFTVLRPLIDEYRKPGRFLLLGSVSPFLYKQISQTLAGRVGHIELPPINIIEANKIGIPVLTLWLKGGYPEPLMYKKMNKWLLWMKNYEDTFVRRDVTFLMNESLSPSTVQKIWHVLSSINGQLVNYEDISRTVGLSRSTVIKYVDFLESAYLVRRLQPWHMNISKRLVKAHKIYFRDSGLLHSMHGISSLDELTGHIICGSSWEGFVIQQIIQILPNYVSAYFYRTHHGAESDLVLVKGNKPIVSIEIKLNNAPSISKGFYQSIDDLKTNYNFVITPESDTYKNKNITICSLFNFIQKFLPKVTK